MLTIEKMPIRSKNCRLRTPEKYYNNLTFAKLLWGRSHNTSQFCAVFLNRRVVADFEWVVELFLEKK